MNNVKYNILNGDNSRFAAFYRNFRCWRLYTTDGYLIKEIHLEKIMEYNLLALY